MVRKLKISIILLQTLILTVFTQGEEQIDLVRVQCLTSDNVTTNGAYHTNVVAVLTELTSLSAFTKFASTSSGLDPESVNGLYLCRPDLPLETCSACINTAIDFYNRYCFDKKEAIIWFQECFIRYTNKSIIASEQLEPEIKNWSIFNVSQPAKFSSILSKTMSELIANATDPTNKDLFAFGSASYTLFEGFYGMVICTPDLTPLLCRHCLTTAFNRIPAGGLATWSYVLLPSCQLKYDTAPFIFPPSPPSLPPAVAPSPLA